MVYQTNLHISKTNFLYPLKLGFYLIFDLRWHRNIIFAFLQEKTKTKSRMKSYKSALALTFFIAITVSLLTACGSDSGTKGTGDGDGEKSTVVVHLLGNPDMLNPVNNQGASSTALMCNIFQRLMYPDYRTLELAPVLAVSAPDTIVVTDSISGESFIHVTYNLRPEAKWDNGEPVLASDVVFTHKVVKNPNVDAMPKRSYLNKVRDIITYDDDPLKVTFVCDIYVRAVYSTAAEVPIIPEYHYDPTGMMKGFTIQQLTDDADALKADPTLVAFAEEFNSAKYQKEPGQVVGSGAYEFTQWEDNIRITLKKKEDWWGDAITETSNFFENNVDRITYQLIKDMTSAITAMKSQDLDVMRGIRSKDFVDLKDSESFNKNFDRIAESQLAYTYLGVNSTSPALSGVKTRQAIGYLLDINSIIDDIAYGYGDRMIGTVHLTNKVYYNNNVDPREFNPEKAKQLLAEDGWEDMDGDGILDRLVEGEVIPFDIKFSFNSGNDERKAVGQMLKEEARKVGIRITIVEQEWSIYIDNQTDHNFDICFSAWILEVAPDDPHQLFHTESANGGSNYTAWGDVHSDSIIEEIGRTINEDKAQALWYELQVMMHETVPYVFGYAPKNKMAISKHFDNAYSSAMYPGYWEAGFKPKKAQ
jgi:ABC-type transport system substrate-binding protein